MLNPFPEFTCGNADLAKAFRVAIGDIFSNLVYMRQGQLDKDSLCLAAGLDYAQLWTRDNAVNTWHAAGLLLPEVARNSLRAILIRDEDGAWRIGGQYWDAILWAQGAWALYLYQGDKAFLAESLGIIERSLLHLEQTEFDEAEGLFRGPAFFQDGISGYPDDCATGHGSEVLEWVKYNPAQKAPKGYGIPWFALSTNLLYCRAYDLIPQIRAELGLPPSATAANAAKGLRLAIQTRFWNDSRGSFDYLLLPGGRRVEHQEGAGLAFAILFDVATPEQITSLVHRLERQPGGLPAVWPQFERFAAYGQGHFGRHAGCVWPHVQGMWARAALKAGRPDLFWSELDLLARHAVRDGHFTELYHPETGEEYGGIQENFHTGEIEVWKSVPHTCWGASCFIGAVHMGLFGMSYEPEGVWFQPSLPEGCGPAALRNIPYRGALLNVELTGCGTRISQCLVQGKESPPFVAATAEGNITISIAMS